MRPSATVLYALYATSITICNSVTRTTPTVNLFTAASESYENSGVPDRSDRFRWQEILGVGQGVAQMLGEAVLVPARRAGVRGHEIGGVGLGVAPPREGG